MNLSETLAKIPGLAQGREWFDARTSRERILLSGLTVAGVCAVVAMGVWRPLVAQRDAALSEIARYDEVLAQVRAVGPAGLNASAGRAGGEASAPSIADSAASHGLLIRRIEPDGENTRVALEDADFVHVLDWIASMESAAIARVASIQMDRRPAPGTVNVQVTLEN